MNIFKIAGLFSGYLTLFSIILNKNKNSIQDIQSVSKKLNNLHTEINNLITLINHRARDPEYKEKMQQILSLLNSLDFEIENGELKRHINTDSSNFIKNLLEKTRQIMSKPNFYPRLTCDFLNFLEGNEYEEWRKKGTINTKSLENLSKELTFLSKETFSKKEIFSSLIVSFILFILSIYLISFLINFLFPRLYNIIMNNFNNSFQIPILQSWVQR